MMTKVVDNDDFIIITGANIVDMNSFLFLLFAIENGYVQSLLGNKGWDFYINGCDKDNLLYYFNLSKKENKRCPYVPSVVKFAFESKTEFCRTKENICMPDKEYAVFYFGKRMDMIIWIKLLMKFLNTKKIRSIDCWIDDIENKVIFSKEDYQFYIKKESDVSHCDLLQNETGFRMVIPSLDCIFDTKQSEAKLIFHGHDEFINAFKTCNDSGDMFHSALNIDECGREIDISISLRNDCPAEMLSASYNCFIYALFFLKDIVDTAKVTEFIDYWTIKYNDGNPHISLSFTNKKDTTAPKIINFFKKYNSLLPTNFLDLCNNGSVDIPIFILAHRFCSSKLCLDYFTDFKTFSDSIPSDFVGSIKRSFSEMSKDLLLIHTIDDIRSHVPKREKRFEVYLKKDHETTNNPIKVVFNFLSMLFDYLMSALLSFYNIISVASINNNLEAVFRCSHDTECKISREDKCSDNSAINHVKVTSLSDDSSMYR